jgi:hypothetical protein
VPFNRQRINVAAGKPKDYKGKLSIARHHYPHQVMMSDKQGVKLHTRPERIHDIPKFDNKIFKLEVMASERDAKGLYVNAPIISNCRTKEHLAETGCVASASNSTTPIGTTTTPIGDTEGSDISNSVLRNGKRMINRSIELLKDST